MMKFLIGIYNKGLSAYKEVEITTNGVVINQA